MIYRFHSKASGDVLMLGPVGDKVLTAMGIAAAATGIIPPAAMPAAIEAVEAAIARDESTRGETQVAAPGAGESAADDDGVSLRQRAWPLVEMMKRAQAEGEAIVWGV